MMGVPGGIATFLFTDIEGSTRLWEQRATQMREALARHDAVVREAVDANRGQVFKTVGDAFCAAFRTAPDAIAAALRAQVCLASLATADLPLRVRMAIHAGAAEQRDGDYFGPPLNRAARLRDAAHGGQVLLSLAAEELARDELPHGCTLRDLGEHRLRDLERAEHVFQLAHPSLPADFPPLLTVDRLRNNLPAQLTSFIGREKEIAEVRKRLAANRLVTLTGSGGCGKSRLSLHVAADVLGEYRDGLWLVELATLSDGGVVPQVVAQVLGVAEEPGEPLMRTLTEWLAPKQLLVILDNCEHLLEGCALLADALLRACPGVRLLATSREALHIMGEVVYRVPSLSSPDSGQGAAADRHAAGSSCPMPDAQSLLRYEAVELFVGRAAAVAPTFALTERNAAAVGRICSHLDGIPLAIELAAARVRAMPVEHIAGRLDNRFRLLTGGSRTDMPRHQTLRALIDWSYDLLSDPERALLARLSVFAGGWALDAAEQVGSDVTPAELVGSGVHTEDVLNLLTSLVDKSLVVYEDQEPSGRYRLLETVRQYGAERLAESGGTESARSRHLAYFLRLAEEAEENVHGPRQVAWLARLDIEEDNMRAALGFSIEPAVHDGLFADQTRDLPAAACERTRAGLRLAGSLAEFWESRCSWGGREYLAAILARPGAAAPTPARAKALHAAGRLAGRQGEYALARSFVGESLAIARALGHDEHTSTALVELANIAYHCGDYAAARSLGEESLALSRRSGDHYGTARALFYLGMQAIGRTDYAVARTLYEESVGILRCLGDRCRLTSALGNLAVAAFRQGDYAYVRSLNEECLSLSRGLALPYHIAYTLARMGRLEVAEGRPGLARPLYAESLGMVREMGDRKGILDALINVGCLAVAERNWQRAARLLAAAETLREAIGYVVAPCDREEYDGALAAARSQLGDEAFSSACALGRAMTPEQAVEYALHGGAADLPASQRAA